MGSCPGCCVHRKQSWVLWLYLWPQFLQQLDGLVGEEVVPLDVPLLVRVQGRELQGCLLLLRLRHGPLKLLLVHQVLVVQEVVQGQTGLWGDTDQHLGRGDLPPRTVWDPTQGGGGLHLE